MRGGTSRASRVAGPVTTGAALGMRGTTPARAAAWTGGPVSWSANGELMKVTDTKAAGYSFGVTVADTKVPNVVAVCRSPRLPGTRRPVTSRTRRGTIEPGGSATVRS